MRDIYGEDYLLISKYDYNRLLDRIEELEKIEQEYREYVTNLASNCRQTSEKMFADTIDFLLNNEIKVTPKQN